MRKVDFDYSAKQKELALSEKEKSVIKQLDAFDQTVDLAAKQHSPAIIANYTYDLVKEYNSFYQSSPIIHCEDEALKIFITRFQSRLLK